MVDHRVLLAKYAAYVHERFGANGIDDLRRPGDIGCAYAHGLRDEELVELRDAQVRGQRIFGRHWNGRPPPEARVG